MLFPHYTIYSTPLLILIIQVLIFASLLLRKSIKVKDVSYFLLFLILIITCWHRTTYTIGFMGWYDAYKTTKINYYLLDLTLGFGPLLYFYIRSITVPNFQWKYIDILHFIPVSLFIVYKAFLLVYDANQPGFEETQNGVLLENFHWKYADTYIIIAQKISMFAYLFLSIRCYQKYYASLNMEISNTYKIEFRWVKNFLYAFSIIFIYGLLQSIIDGFIKDLWYTHVWYSHILSLLIALYLGITGLYTDTGKLSLLYEPLEEKAKSNDSKIADRDIQKVLDHVNKNQSYLDPDLNLGQLSKELKMYPGQLSEIINAGIGVNFNDFINNKRVETIKEVIRSKKQDHKSLLAIAQECGFNSKATFNRVFKKTTGQSPSEYRSSQD